MTTSRLRALPALLGAAVLLSGCSVLQKDKSLPPCPPVYILGDAATITKYRPGPGRDLTDVEVQGEIVGWSGNCSYDAKGANITMQVAIEAKRGPANATRKAELSYFVAVPYYFPNPEAKGVFPLAVEFPEGQNTVRVTDDVVTLQIPVKNKEVIDKFEIYLGFQTSPEELEQNRKGK
jgi:hypothetical protein